MNLMNNVTSVLKDVAKETGENKSTILVCGAVIGTICTVATTVKGSFEAKTIMDENKEHVTTDVWLDVCKCYIPSVLCTTATIACIICAQKENATKYAALTALYASDSKKIDDISKKMKKTMGLRESETKKFETENTESQYKNIQKIVFDDGQKVRFYDEFCGRFVDATYESLDMAVLAVNADLMSDGYAKLEVFYSGLNTDFCAPSQEAYGWTCDVGPLMLNYEGALDENNRPYVIFSFNNEPRLRY